MKIIVEDTNIIIDLFKTGLLSFCMELKLEFHTTRYVVAEILESSQSAVLIGMINNGQLLIDDFVGEEYERLIKYIDECNGENNLSEADCSVLLLAKRLGCRLLTSDQNHLNRYLETNPRAPENEVLKRIEYYKINF